MTTQVQIRGAVEATQEARTLVARELDINTTDSRLNVHDGTTVGGVPHVNYSDLQNQEFVYAAASGTNSITISLSKAPGSYIAGQRFVFKAAATNTGSVTINVNSLGAKTIKKMSGGALLSLQAGDIVSGGIYSVTYDGTDMLISLGGGGGWKQVASTSITGSPSVIDFNSVFDANKEYVFIFDQIQPATNNVGFRLRFSSNGGSSFLASSYTFSTFKANNAAIAVSSGSASDTAIVLTTGGNSTSGATLNGVLNIPNPYTTFSRKNINFTFFGSFLTTDTTTATESGSGSLVNAAQMDSVRFFWTSGNFANTGTIYLYERDL